MKDLIVWFYEDFTAKGEFDAQYIGARLLCYLISVHTKDLTNQIYHSNQGWLFHR